MNLLNPLFEFLAWLGCVMLWMKGADVVTSSPSANGVLHHWWFWPSWFGGMMEGYTMIAGAIGVSVILFRVDPHGRRFIAWWQRDTDK